MHFRELTFSLFFSIKYYEMILKLILITTFNLAVFAACTQEIPTTSPQSVDSTNSGATTSSVIEVPNTAIPVPTNTAMPKVISTPVSYTHLRAHET